MTRGPTEGGYALTFPVPEAEIPGYSVKSAVQVDRGSVTTASGGDMSLNGLVSGTSVLVDLELSASTNGLVTVEYDASLLSFAGVSGNGLNILWSSVSAVGEVTIAYTCADALTGMALTLSFYYGAGQPAADALFTFSAAKLGAERFDAETALDALELHLPYIPAAPVALDVTTSDIPVEGEVVTETTARPGSTAADGEYTSSVSDSMGTAMVEQAQERQSDTVVVAPKMPGTAEKTVVNIPASTVSEIGEKTDANLRVETPRGLRRPPQRHARGARQRRRVRFLREKRR